MVINSEIIKLINEHDKISIFIHEKPDPDALGSSFAMKELIESNWDNKEVAIIGLDLLEKNRLYNYFNDNYNKHPVDESFIKDSLGIVVDTANNARVLSNLNTLTKASIRFDHHPFVEKFCDVELVDSSKSSNCEVLVNFIKSNPDFKITKKLAKYLYIGMIGDTNRFMYQPNKDTFEHAGWLIDNGADWMEVYSLLFDKSFKEIKKELAITRKIKIKNGIGYLVLKSKKINSSKIYLLNNIKDFDICVAIYYDYADKIWKGSIRSKKIVINDVAQRYNGGGHKLASGFKIKHKTEFKKVLKELEEKLEHGETV